MEAQQIVETRNKGRQGTQHKETWGTETLKEHRDERQIGGNRDRQGTDVGNRHKAKIYCREEM
jgi:hypothetical protein